MNHFTASYMDALSRSNSGILIEKDNALYYAIPSLDAALVNSWIQLQEPVTANLRICGIYSTDQVNILDLDFIQDHMYYINYDIVYKVKWLLPKVKELGYYTSQIDKLSLKVDKKEFKQGTMDDLLQKILQDLKDLDLKKGSRLLLNTLCARDLGGLGEIKDLIKQVITQTRIEGAKSF